MRRFVRLGLCVGIAVLSLADLRCTCYRPQARFADESRLVLLTFDDGPTNDRNVTRELLAVLKRHNVKALFNIIGRNAGQYPAIVRQIYDDGHILSNHGYSEWPLLCRSRGAIRDEIDRCNHVLRSAVQDSSFTPHYFRPACGWYNPRTLRLLEQRGLRMNGISVWVSDSRRGPQQCGKVIENAVAAVVSHNGGMVVLHDGVGEYSLLERYAHSGWKRFDRSYIPVAADSIITILRRKGFQFPALDDGLSHELSLSQQRFFGELLR
jgi:peptidoglycan/xylan/chitin deacetylase (PgdA/CDA1 family)